MPGTRPQSTGDNPGHDPISIFQVQSKSSNDDQMHPAYGPAYGSTRSLPGYYGSSKKPKIPFKIGKGGIQRADSVPGGQFPVYLDDRVLKQVRENTSRFIQKRITNVEKHFGEMCQGFGHYLRSMSKLRDSGDDLARDMVTYAEKESFNTTTRDALMNFAANISAVEDYRDVTIQRLENKVLGPLTQYGTECKHAKEKLKQAFSARNKELKEQKNLNKAKSKPTERQNISQAETELQKASVDATRASKQLETEMDAFERRKLDDIKKIFMDMVNVEMLFHARALERYTKCYQNLSIMDEENDLEEFRSSLRPPSVQGGRLDKMASGSKTSLNTTGVSGARSTPATTPSGARKGAASGTPNDTLNTTNRSSMYSDGQDDDYDDDDDDDSDEESEEEIRSKPQKYQHRK